VRQVRRVGLATFVICVVAACAALFGGAGASAHGKGAKPFGYFVPSGQPVQSDPLTSPPCRHLCYSPQQLQVAYDFPTDRHAPTGDGQTIAIVVAYGNPTVEPDLAAYNTMFGLPQTTITYCGAPNTGTDDPAQFQWMPETSADVEFAHAMAPDAQLVLVISPTADFTDIAATEASCLPQYPGAIVSQSFGEDEIDASDPAVAAAFDSLHDTYVAVTKAGGTVLAAAGDFGATGIDGTGITAEYPASDPLVTAVGGTEGDPYPDGLLQTIPGHGHGRQSADQIVYGGEQTWNETDLVGLATGGAPSILFATPDYQQGFNDSAWRTTSDVAFDAAAQGAEAAIFAGSLGGFVGTSAGPPNWAAIVALANGQRADRHRDAIGQLNPALYTIAGNRGQYRHDFHDITLGNNQDEGDGFDAGPGYDLPTGLGTPDVANLLPDLVNARSKHDDDGDGHRVGDGGHGRGHHWAEVG
jgi:subtilase family serine protease